MRLIWIHDQVRRRAGPVLWFVCLWAALGAGAAWAGDVDLKNRASLSAEYDDNVYKANRDLTADFLGRLFYDFGLNWRITPNNIWLTNYQLGGKLYAQETEEDTIINQLQLGYTNYSIRTVQMGVQGSAKLRNIRSAEEDYLKFIGRAFVGKRFIDSIYAGIHAQYSEFDFRGSDYYDYWTQLYGAEFRYDFKRTFSVGAGYNYERKTYPFNALRNIGEENILLVERDDKRKDNLNEVRASVRYQTAFFERLPFMTTLTYTYQNNASNSYGDAYDNHRVTVGLSQYVLEDTSVHFVGTFQFRDSKEKVLIPHSYSIEEDDENYNQIQARLTHSFTEYFSLYGSYQRFWSNFDHDRLSFVRNLYALGITFRF
ncbi:MAG: hypothetical protein P9L99_16020 [Candidatus Lernaella stagnicola]|nr:hypothetical protein [Candidatus Lernaella stagnicola]